MRFNWFFNLFTRPPFSLFLFYIRHKIRSRCYGNAAETLLHVIDFDIFLFSLLFLFLLFFRKCPVNVDNRRLNATLPLLHLATARLLSASIKWRLNTSKYPRTHQIHHIKLNIMLHSIILHYIEYHIIFHIILCL